MKKSLQLKVRILLIRLSWNRLHAESQDPPFGQSGSGAHLALSPFWRLHLLENLSYDCMPGDSIRSSSVTVE